MYNLNYKKYSPPAFGKAEALRYAGCREDDSSINELISACFNEIENQLEYKVCWLRLPLKITNDISDFQLFSFKSKKLAANLNNCNEAILFAATTGVALDRLISKYSKLSPLKALLFQAIGAERIEALCDTFCEDIAHSLNCSTRPRFSPGYGDLELECQKKIFAVLDCERKLGLTLNQSLLMSPSKSVTAIMGINQN